MLGLLTSLTLHWLVNFLLIIGLFVVYFYAVRKFAIKGFELFASKKFPQLKKSDAYKKFPRFLRHFAIGLYLIMWKSTIIPSFGPVLPALPVIFNSILLVYFTFFTAGALFAAADMCAYIYKSGNKEKSKATGLYLQISKIVISLFAIIICISEILNISLTVFFTSIGAATALVSFVFQDTIRGLVASFQLTMQDAVREGDWLHIPSLGVEGDLEEITITTTKIRNFDKTISIVPTHALLKCDIKNWRGMQEAGGRRIKRALHIDIGSVKFCDDAMIKDFKKLPHLDKFFEDNKGKKASELTNIGVFRHYIVGYLRHNSNIHQTNFTFLVRQLEATRYGLPIQLYIFTNDTDWTKYEDIQSDIFDHLFAIAGEFGLGIFQNISGKSGKALLELKK